MGVIHVNGGSSMGIGSSTVGQLIANQNLRPQGMQVVSLQKGCIPSGYELKYHPGVLNSDIVVIDHDNKKAFACVRRIPSECWEDGVANYEGNQPSNWTAFKFDVEDEASWTIASDNSTPEPNAPRYTPGMSITDFVDSEIKNEEKSKQPDRERLKWLRTFQRCVLPIHVKQTIEEALTVVLNSDKFDSWGISESFEKGITNSILLYGPPGTGKTMIAESIAAVLNQGLMSLDTADLQSQIPGQMERNIKKAFEKADAEDAVLLIDECDSLLYDRNAVGMIIAAEINTLLREIENFDGVCILTTNRLGHLDAALQRRIIAKVELGLPSEEQRREIWKKLLPVKMPVKDLNFDLLSLHPLSGGDIKNAILLAARKAVAANMEHVTQEHFNQVLAHIVKSKDDFKKQTGRPAFFKQAGHDINKWASA